jgi:hypothetical protein
MGCCAGARGLNCELACSAWRRESVAALQDKAKAIEKELAALVAEEKRLSKGRKALVDDHGLDL